MAQQVIFTGTTVNDGTGAAARTWAIKSNQNFTELYDIVANKANTSHTHTANDVTDFNEAVDDRVAALLVEGNNISITYNDANAQSL